MAKSRKLIVILIDGVSADYVADHQTRLPNLRKLADRGMSVERLGAASPAVSMPARATMLTGAGADRHGVYGNRILDEGAVGLPRFRWVKPYDVAVPTIAGLARNQGKKVASLGFGLVRPEDCDVFLPPWWIRKHLGLAETDGFAKLPADVARYASQVKDPNGQLTPLLTDTLGTEVGGEERPLPRHPQAAGLHGDQRNMAATAALACSQNAPDLILTEIMMTDTVQHQSGFESDASHLITTVADMMVGALTEALAHHNKRDEFVLVVASDHGHSPIKTAIYPESIIDSAVFTNEGATLNMVVQDTRQRDRYAERLRPFGVEMGNGDDLPPRVRDKLVRFFAPVGHSFEDHPDHRPATQQTGSPHYVSSHGFKPGSRVDDRFWVLAGPGVPRASIRFADADQFAPTLAEILSLPTDGFAAPGLGLTSRSSSNTTSTAAGTALRR